MPRYRTHSCPYFDTFSSETAPRVRTCSKQKNSTASTVDQSNFGVDIMSIVSGPARLAAIVMLAVLSVTVTTPATKAYAAGCLPASLKSKLSQIRAKFGPVSIVSTHRRGARIAGSGKRSYHASCRAVDFHPPKGKYRQVVAWLKANHAGGVGTYSCGMHHVHIDNGPRVRFHHCVNARGRPMAKAAAMPQSARVTKSVTHPRQANGSSRPSATQQTASARRLGTRKP